MHKKLSVLLMAAMLLVMSAAPAFAQEKPPLRATCRAQLQVSDIQENGGRQSGQVTAMFARLGG
jgi:hypothetical protein